MVYYSQSGNNAFLANKIARQTGADIAAIRPTIGLSPIVIILSLLKTGIGIQPFDQNIAGYDRIVMCGPIWAGCLNSPVLDFIKKFRNMAGRMSYATCCGSKDDDKEGKYGYNRVFRQVKDLSGNQNMICEAFPIPLALPVEQRNDGKAIMATKLSDANFTGELVERLGGFVGR